MHNNLQNNQRYFWQDDLLYKNQLIADRLNKTSINKIALSQLKQELHRVPSSSGYQNVIAKLDSELGTLLVTGAIHSNEPNIAPAKLRSTKIVTNNPWSFNYTRWYSDTVYQKEKEYTRIFYQTDELVSFITNSGMSAFQLTLNIINSYLKYSHATPYYKFDSNTYGECVHLLSQQSHRNKIEEIQLYKNLRDQLTGNEKKIIPIILIDFTDADHAKNALSQLNQRYKRKIILILDITRFPDYLIVNCQIKKYLRSSWIVFRFSSLSKYHYAGLGIGRAGVVTMKREQCEALTDPITSYHGVKLVTYYRALIGGSLEPYQAEMIPLFSLSYIKEKVFTHYRNANLISRILIDNRDKISLQSYDPSTDSIMDNHLCTQGFCLFISLKNKANYHSTVNQIIADLAKQNIITEERGSFGFRNTTFDIWTDKAIRISAGCEEEPTMEIIANTILKHLLRQAEG